MKPIIITCLLSLVFFQVAKSQDTLYKPRVYNSIIKQYGVKPVKGYLATIRDSSLYITQSEVYLNFDTANLSYFQKFDYKSLVSVKLYNRSKRGRTFLICILTGVVAGALIGYSGGNDTGWFALTAGGKAVVGGIIGAGAGSIVGAIIAADNEKKFLINGEWESLRDMKEGLQKNR